MARPEADNKRRDVLVDWEPIKLVCLGPGHWTDTKSFLVASAPARSLPAPRRLMSLPDPLGQLRDLDQSAPEFPDRLRSLLVGQRYRDCVANLQTEDLTWLVEYLSTVRVCIVFTNPQPNLA